MELVEFENRLVHQIQSLKVFAKRFTNNEDDSNDLVQETLLKALRFWNSFKEDTNFRGWLHTIMRNAFIDSYHFKIQRRPEDIEPDDIPASQLSVPVIRNDADSKLALGDIKSELNRLDKQVSVPFTMFSEGYKYHEIAERLSVPIGTIKTRIHLARKSLKVRLHHYRISA